MKTKKNISWCVYCTELIANLFRIFQTEEKLRKERGVTLDE